MRLFVCLSQLSIKTRIETTHEKSIIIRYERLSQLSIKTRIETVDLELDRSLKSRFESAIH